MSALLWDGSPYRLIAAIDEYAIAFHTSRRLLDELAHVLACALAAKADWIVSGDRHLLNLKHYHGMRIIDAAEAVRSLAQ